jgi:hypothetical protein
VSVGVGFVCRAQTTVKIYSWKQHTGPQRKESVRGKRPKEAGSTRMKVKIKKNFFFHVPKPKQTVGLLG